MNNIKTRKQTPCISIKEENSMAFAKLTIRANSETKRNLQYKQNIFYSNFQHFFGKELTRLALQQHARLQRKHTHDAYEEG